jgi:hypothetical protein
MLLITIILVFWYLWHKSKKVERKIRAGKKLSFFEELTFTGHWPPVGGD